MDFIPIPKRIHLLKSVQVVSLVGVVLIARPTSIFGSASYSEPVVTVTDSQLTSPVEKGTQADRLIAVGYVITLIQILSLNTFKDCFGWSCGHFRSLYVKSFLRWRNH